MSIQRSITKVVYSFLSISAITCAVAQNAGPELKIVIVEGAGGTNNIRKGAGTSRPVVEVRDRNDKPVAGAIVTFTLPQTGPGGTFVSGGKLATLTTDSLGRASASFNPSGAGSFNLNVTAAHQGQTASLSIAQTNVVAATAAISGVMAGVIAAVAGGAIVGVLCGTGKCGGGDPPTAAPPPAAAAGVRIGLGAGPVTVLPPPR